MATFAELCAEVHTITNRPDLVAETKTAVKAATLKAHQVDYFYKDLFEVGVSFDTEDYVQSLEYRSVVDNYRALKYIRKTDANGAADGAFLDLLTIEETVDTYGLNKNDICYVAGNVIQIRSSTPLQYIFFGCYLNPVIVEAQYNSWVAQDHPYAIIFDAAATVFKMIGFDEQATLYRQLVAEQIVLLKTSNIEAGGR